MPDGSREYIFEFNDRGRGPAVRSRIVLDERGIPTTITVDGHDYLKNAIAERFSIEDGKAAWKNKVEEGERQLDGAGFLSQPVRHAGGAAAARAGADGVAGPDAAPAAAGRSADRSSSTNDGDGGREIPRVAALCGLTVSATSRPVSAGRARGFLRPGRQLVPAGAGRMGIDGKGTAGGAGGPPRATCAASRRRGFAACLPRRSSSSTPISSMPRRADAAGHEVVIEGNTIRAVGADGTLSRFRRTPSVSTRRDARCCRASGTCTAIPSPRTDCCSSQPA